MTDSKAPAPWWKGATIYQIYPRSFQDDNGDGIGDLKGIIRRLDHVASLGVDGIWLSPVFRSPMADMGYDVSDYTDIDPMFGTLQDCRTLIDRAHELGLKVIFDQVLNHTAALHPWFVESRRSRDNAHADWYVWADPKPDGTPPNNWQSLFGGPAWEYEPSRGQYYFHNFLTAQPDLNFHNPDVQDAILATVEFWLDFGIDGFRLDTVNYYFHDALLRDDPPIAAMAGKRWVRTYDAQDHIHSKSRPENIAFLQRLRKLADRYDDIMLVGEVGDEAYSIDTMAAYTRGGDRLHMAYSFEMLGPDFSARHFRRCLTEFFEGAPDGWPSWSFSNHDVPRHVSRWASHGRSTDALARQTAALLFSLQGSIGIYQGEELGLEETDLEFHELSDLANERLWPEYKGRDGCRTPMVWDASEHGGFSTARPWLPVKDPQRTRNVAAQEVQTDSILNFYRRIIAWRNANPLLRTEPTLFHDLPEPVLAFERGTGPGRWLCIFNLSPEPLRLRAKGLGAEGLDALETVSFGAGPSADGLDLEGNGFVLCRPGGEVNLAID